MGAFDHAIQSHVAQLVGVTDHGIGTQIPVELATHPNRGRQRGHGLLWDQAEVSATNVDPAAAVQTPQVDSVELEAVRGDGGPGAGQAGEGVEDRRLAAAGGTYQPEDLAPLDREGDSVHRRARRPAVTARVGDGQPSNGQPWRRLGGHGTKVRF